MLAGPSTREVGTTLHSAAVAAANACTIVITHNQPQQTWTSSSANRLAARILSHCPAAEDISVRHGSANRPPRGSNSVATEGSSRGRFSLRPWRSASQAALQGGSMHG
jgi:hypothetical protein